MDGVIAQSFHARSEAIRTFGIRDPSRVRVIEHGSYIGCYPDTISGDAARAILGLPPEALVFLFLGRIEPYKGVLELIDSFRKLEAPDARLLVAGLPANDEDRRRIEQAAGGDERILFRPGYVPADQMQVFLRAADVFVAPFRYILTSSSIVLGMSFAKAVIAPAQGCIPETVGPEGGFLYPADDPSGLAQALGNAYLDRQTLAEMVLATAGERRNGPGIGRCRRPWTFTEGSSANGTDARTIGATMKITVLPGRSLGADHSSLWARFQAEDPRPGQSLFRARVHGRRCRRPRRRGGGCPGGWRRSYRVLPVPARFVRPWPPRGRAAVGFPGRHCPSGGRLVGGGIDAWACGLVGWAFTHAVASQKPLEPYHTARVDSPAIDVSAGYDAYIQGRRADGSRLVIKVPRSGRKLEREVGPLRFFANLDDAALLDRLVAWKCNQYRRTGVLDVFKYGWTVRLLHHLRAVRSDGFAGMLSALFAGDTLVAAHMGMRFAPRLALLVSLLRPPVRLLLAGPLAASEDGRSGACPGHPPDRPGEGNDPLQTAVDDRRPDGRRGPGGAAFGGLPGESVLEGNGGLGAGFAPETVRPSAGAVGPFGPELAGLPLAITPCEVAVGAETLTFECRSAAEALADPALVSLWNAAVAGSGNLRAPHQSPFWVRYRLRRATRFGCSRPMMATASRWALPLVQTWPLTLKVRNWVLYKKVLQGGLLMGSSALVPPHAFDHLLGAIHDRLPGCDAIWIDGLVQGGRRSGIISGTRAN